MKTHQKAIFTNRIICIAIIVFTIKNSIVTFNYNIIFLMEYEIQMYMFVSQYLTQGRNHISVLQKSGRNQ